MTGRPTTTRGGRPFGPARLPGFLAAVALGAATLVMAVPSSAVEFNAAVSPPRFELRADAGDVIRDVIRISNLGDTPAELLVRTADWDLSESGGLKIHGEALQPGSCRPWSRIERHRVTVAPRERRNYRFEVHVPEDAKAGECRFAVLFQQPEETADRMAMADGVSLPVVGQVAVIVYVAVGGAAPQLEVAEAVPSPSGGAPLLLMVQNSGNAHGRPAGVITGRDAKGREFQFEVGQVAVLPGMKRQVPLWPERSDDNRPQIAYPIQLEGSVEWRDGKARVSTTVQSGPGTVDPDATR